MRPAISAKIGRIGWRQNGGTTRMMALRLVVITILCAGLYLPFRVCASACNAETIGYLFRDGHSLVRGTSLSPIAGFVWPCYAFLCALITSLGLGWKSRNQVSPLLFLLTATVACYLPALVDAWGLGFSDALFGLLGYKGAVGDGLTSLRISFYMCPLILCGYGAFVWAKGRRRSEALENGGRAGSPMKSEVKAESSRS